MEFNSTLTTVISIFLLLLTGYGAKKAGILKSGDATTINSIVVNLTMPAFIFVFTHGKPITQAMIKTPFLGFAMEMVVLGLAWLAARALKLDRPTTGALMLITAFGNTGFLGYPVVSAAYHGDKHAILTAVMFDQFAMSLALNSIGVAVATCFAGSKFQWRSLLHFVKGPLLPATIIALIFRKAYVPSLIMSPLTYLSAATVPLAMISIGLSLSGSSLRQYPAAFGTAIVLKMALLPVLMYFALPLIGVTGTIAKVVVLESAMPSAVVSGVIASRYGANGRFAAGAIFVMTLLSVIMIPCMLMILG